MWKTNCFQTPSKTSEATVNMQILVVLFMAILYPFFWHLLRVVFSVPSWLSPPGYSRHHELSCPKLDQTSVFLLTSLFLFSHVPRDSPSPPPSRREIQKATKDHWLTPFRKCRIWLLSPRMQPVAASSPLIWTPTSPPKAHQCLWPTLDNWRDTSENNKVHYVKSYWKSLWASHHWSDNPPSHQPWGLGKLWRWCGQARAGTGAEMPISGLSDGKKTPLAWTGIFISGCYARLGHKNGVQTWDLKIRLRLLALSFHSWGAIVFHDQKREIRAKSSWKPPSPPLLPNRWMILLGC